jgi:hypothetical protein
MEQRFMKHKHQSLNGAGYGLPNSAIGRLSQYSCASRSKPRRAPGRRETMKKMSIRKAGTIRLTTAAYYCCVLA